MCSMLPQTSPHCRTCRSTDSAVRTSTVTLLRHCSPVLCPVPAPEPQDQRRWRTPSRCPQSQLDQPCASQTPENDLYEDCAVQVPTWLAVRRRLASRRGTQLQLASAQASDACASAWRRARGLLGAASSLEPLPGTSAQPECAMTMTGNGPVPATAAALRSGLVRAPRLRCARWW